MGTVIGAVTANGVAVAIIPGDILDVVTAGIHRAAALVAATCRILPLGLGGQTEVLAREDIQAVDEFLAIGPAYLLNGTVGITGEAAGIATHNGLPQFLGYLGLTDAVGFQGHFDGGQLVGIGDASIDHSRVNTHGEGASLDRNHLERNAIDGVHAGNGVVILHALDERVGSGLQFAEVLVHNRAAVEQQHHQSAGIGTLHVGQTVGREFGAVFPLLLVLDPVPLLDVLFLDALLAVELDALEHERYEHALNTRCSHAVARGAGHAVIGDVG